MLGRDLKDCLHPRKKTKKNNLEILRRFFSWNQNYSFVSHQFWFLSSQSDILSDTLRDIIRPILKLWIQFPQCRKPKFQWKVLQSLTINFIRNEFKLKYLLNFVDDSSMVPIEFYRIKPPNDIKTFDPYFLLYLLFQYYGFRLFFPRTCLGLLIRNLFSSGKHYPFEKVLNTRFGISKEQKTNMKTKKSGKNWSAYF